MKKNAFISLLFLSLVFILVSCDNENSRIKRIVDTVGQNKNEVKKVLNHYSKEKDSMKLKAAFFLLENMIDKKHTTVIPKDKWDALLKYSASEIRKGVDMESYVKNIDSIKNSTGFYFKQVEDIKIISAAELIKNIDLAFEVWPKPWNNNLEFMEFCDFILPYKSHNEAFNVNFREDFFKNNIGKITKDFKIDFAKEIIPFPENCIYHEIQPHEQSINDIKKGLTADCVDQANLGASKARAVGLPFSIDWAIWPNGRGRHSWNSLVHNKDSLIYADKDFFWGKPTEYESLRRVSKVYRYTFEKVNKKNRKPRIAPLEARHLYDNNIVDVTSQYIRTVSVNVPVQRSNIELEGEVVYLCIFNNLKWTPIALSQVKKDSTSIFENIGPGNIHTIFCSMEGEMIPISHAFTVDNNGELTFFHPLENSKKTVELTRKSKITECVRDFSTSLLGARIELSNNPNFIQNRSFYTIKDTLLKPKSFSLNYSSNYRYARIKCTNNLPLELSEINFYREDKKLNFTVFTSEKKTDPNTLKITDGDPLTYFTAPNSNEFSWVGFDFNKKERITSVTIASRTDLNYIVPGNLYELKYWDFGWQSLGKELANENKIIFKNVPKNALLWLINHSEGVEEDLFIMENGKQKFWNSSDLL